MHTKTDADPPGVHTAAELLEAAEQADLDVIAITDHDVVDRIDELLEASSRPDAVSVIPGVEVTTDAGHVLVYDPSGSSAALLEAYLKRLGARPGKMTRLGELLEVLASEETEEGVTYRQRLVVVGAHVNQAKSLLAADQPGPHSHHLSNAKKMHALEVNDPAVLEEWQKRGIKSTGEQMPLIQGSDGHSPSAIGNRSTWLFMPNVDRSSLLHAFGNFEASVSTTAAKPAHPSAHIVSLSLSDGLHGRIQLNFSERLNAIIGSPSVGKSFIIDAIRYLFDSDSPIDEVALVSNKRRERHLPTGTVIEAQVCVNGETKSYKREVGGAATPTIPTDPVIFSQTELTRRAMEQEPSIGLIDLHTDGLSEAYADLSAVSVKIHALLDELLRLAREHAVLTEKVDNPVDGLGIVEARLGELSGEEDSATRADIVEDILEWRALVRRQIASLKLPAVEISALDDIPDLGQVAEDLASTMPAIHIRALLQAYEKDALTRLESLRTDIEVSLGSDDNLESEQSDLSEKLHELLGQDAQEITAELATLRARRTSLRKARTRRNSVRRQIAKKLSILEKHLQDHQDTSESITSIRKSACRRVNPELGSFFVKVTDPSKDETIAVLRDLRTGARKTTLERLVSAIQTEDLVALVLNNIANGSVAYVSNQVPDDSAVRSIIAALAAEADDGNHLEAYCTVREDDRLEICQRMDSGPPTAFGDMTEGLRALAIKELSFAVSDRIVISDQPEEAVPTRAVYEELVETMRQQRARRQFVLVSHDANVVVGGDADLVIVLTGDENQQVTGTLFDEEICVHALDHLEGGSEAFRRRGERYSTLLM